MCDVKKTLCAAKFTQDKPQRTPSRLKQWFSVSKPRDLLELADFIKNAVLDKLASCLDSADDDVVKHMVHIVKKVKEILGTVAGDLHLAVFYCQIFAQSLDKFPEVQCKIDLRSKV